MAEKTTEFRTSLSVKECGQRFQSAIVQGQTLGSKLGGTMAKLMGGENLGFYTPDDNSPFSSLDDDPPAFSVGVAVPRAYQAHAHGTNLHMYVWDRGDHRDVALWVHHSFTGSKQATDLIAKVQATLVSR